MKQKRKGMLKEANNLFCCYDIMYPCPDKRQAVFIPTRYGTLNYYFIYFA